MTPTVKESDGLPSIFGSALDPHVAVVDGEGVAPHTWSVMIYRGDPEGGATYRAGLSEDAADTLAAWLREHLD